MSKNTLKTRIRHAVKKESEWISSNPVLLSGEIAYNSDNDKYKVGNGTSTWSQLSYKIPVTKSDIGLGNVENTSDMDKPISTAQQSALDKKIILSATEPIGQKIGDVWLIADE